MHQGIENSRRDDLESLCYVMVYMLNGRLPWQNLKGDAAGKMREVEKVKVLYTPQKLCSGLPNEVMKFCEYCFNLSYSETPDYQYLQKLLEDCMRASGYKFDYGYDWSKEPWFSKEQPTQKGDAQREKQM